MTGTSVPFLKEIPVRNPKMGLQRKIPNNILSKWIDAAFVTYAKAPKLFGNSQCLNSEPFSCCGDGGRSFYVVGFGGEFFF